MNNVVSLIPVILSGVVVFITTNIDDLFLLMLLFSQREKILRKQHNIIGQYLGSIVIIAVSTLGFFGRLAVHIPREWIGLLGLIPIVMGFRGIVRLFQKQKKIYEVDEEDNYLQSIKSHPLGYKFFASFLNKETYIVAAMTLSDGTDNIGAYTPLFANGSLTDLIVLIGLFLLLTGIWCYFGYTLAHLPIIARTFDLYGHLLLPFLFLFVGIFVMYESGTLRLLFSWIVIH